GERARPIAVAPPSRERAAARPSARARVRTAAVRGPLRDRVVARDRRVARDLRDRGRARVRTPEIDACGRQDGEERMTLPDPAHALVSGAHPDDLEMGCGGLIRALVRRGHRVVAVDCTRGELSTRGTVESRTKETDAATKALGVVARENLGLPDGSIPPTGAARDGVVALIRKWRPNLLVSPPTPHLHPPHPT